MFSQSTLKYFEKENILTAKLLTTTAIEPDDRNIIDTPNIHRYLILFYPDSMSKGTCVIDIEDFDFYNLRMNANTSLFKKAEEKFIVILQIVKKYRPNVKFGIYGLPFYANYQYQRVYNGRNKFANIFRYCDFIAPSLYFSYSDAEIGHQKNVENLHDNLQIALDYGYRLKKPVIPFIWELIHPSNKRYGGTIIAKDSYLDFVNFLVNYSFKGVSIKGLFLWNPAEPSPIYSILSKGDAIHNRDSLITNYYTGILKILGTYK
jgi:hypothetical protein